MITFWWVPLESKLYGEDQQTEWICWNFPLKFLLRGESIPDVWAALAYTALYVRAEMLVYFERCLLATHSISGFCDLITISLFMKAGDESALNRPLTIIQPVSCDLLKRVRENS